MIFLINAVNIDKLSATQKAFFLAADYQNGPRAPGRKDAKSEARGEESLGPEEERGPGKEEERNYCVCKKAWGGLADEKMIACDGPCKDWYHPSCILMTKSELGLVESNPDTVWLCRNCVKKLTKTN